MLKIIPENEMNNLTDLEKRYFINEHEFFYRIKENGNDEIEKIVCENQKSLENRATTNGTIIIEGDDVWVEVDDEHVVRIDALRNACYRNGIEGEIYTGSGINQPVPTVERYSESLTTQTRQNLRDSLKNVSSDKSRKL